MLSQEPTSFKMGRPILKWTAGFKIGYNINFKLGCNIRRYMIMAYTCSEYHLILWLEAGVLAPDLNFHPCHRPEGI